MTNEVLLFILGGVFTSIGAAASGYILTVQRLTKLETKLENAEKFEQRFNDFIDDLGAKAARGLHRDDDKWRMDALLDKYLERNYELTFEEWGKLRDRCLMVENAGDAPPEEKIFAAWLGAICEHKLRMEPRKRS